MTVQQLRESMTPGEFLAWSRYHATRTMLKQLAAAQGKELING